MSCIYTPQIHIHFNSINIHTQIYKHLLLLFQEIQENGQVEIG